jgi:hypothetical protein
MRIVNLLALVIAVAGSVARAAEPVLRATHAWPPRLSNTKAKASYYKGCLVPTTSPERKSTPSAQRHSTVPAPNCWMYNCA